MTTLKSLSDDLARGRTTARALVDACLDRIAAPTGEGSRVFVKVHADSARATADLVDRLRAHGAAPSPLAGIPVSVKDLFDMVGDVTTAGSEVLRDRPVAATDAVVVARIKAAGLIPIGRTNMTEFAFSGLGLNPHYGTPANPYDRDVDGGEGRIPGGSSSGAAISVTDQMAYAALGTDTGGSCRIPAAFTGIVGYKPTARRVPLDGSVPLSTSLDSIGPLANSVACCAMIDAILAGGPAVEPSPLPVKGLRFAVPETVMLDGLDAHVAASFDKALAKLSQAGAQIVRIPLREIGEIATLNAKGGFAASEAYAWHRKLLESAGDGYDPRVRVRVMRGREQTAADYIELVAARADLIARVNRATRGFDALIAPATPIVAPRLKEVESDAEFGRINLLALRNPTVTNVLDRCAISLPCQEKGSLPVGLMLMGETGADRYLFDVAAGVEAALA